MPRRRVHVHLAIPRERERERERYGGKFAPIPASSQPSQDHRLLGSCQRRPIRFSFHRRSIGGANQISREEEIGGLAASRGPSSIPPPSFHLLLLTLFCTNTHSEIHSHAGGQERGLPWETEAWVKEGCWQPEGLTHLLAASPPPSNALKRTAGQ